MKQFEVTKKTIGDYEFYILPFPAFKAAHISGELAKLLTPIIGSLAPLLGSGNVGVEEDKEKVEFKLQDLEIDKALPVVADAASSLDGDAVEHMMRQLMIDYKNVNVRGEATGGETVTLTEELANEVFCFELQDMYRLCIEIVRINFKGFFKKLGVQSGSLSKIIQIQTPAQESGESST